MKKQDILKMSSWDFDQSPEGWRKLSTTKDYIGATNLIKEYISKNRKGIPNQTYKKKRVSLEIFHFHIGQLLASAGEKYWAEAIKEFRQSFQEGRKCWNAYVSATIGFLERNEKHIEDAIQTIESLPQEDKKEGNLGIVKNFKKGLKIGLRDYEKVYSMPREN